MWLPAITQEARLVYIVCITETTGTFSNVFLELDLASAILLVLATVSCCTSCLVYV